MRETELREKDILIQDNLIRFSTFLQGQEMRRNKDEELAKTEQNVSAFLLKSFFNQLTCYFCAENRRKKERNQAVGGKVENPVSSQRID